MILMLLIVEDIQHLIVLRGKILDVAHAQSSIHVVGQKQLIHGVLLAFWVLLIFLVALPSHYMGYLAELRVSLSLHLVNFTLQQLIVFLNLFGFCFQFFITLGKLITVSVQLLVIVFQIFVFLQQEGYLIQ